MSFTPSEHLLALAYDVRKFLYEVDRLDADTLLADIAVALSGLDELALMRDHAWPFHCASMRDVYTTLVEVSDVLDALASVSWSHAERAEQLESRIVRYIVDGGHSGSFDDAFGAASDVA